MAHLIDKDALVAEIKACIGSVETSQKAGMIKKRDANKKILLLKNVLSLIDTIEVKEVDLEKEMDKKWSKCEPVDEGMGLEIASIEHEQFDNIAKHFFELGLKAQKGV